MYYRQGTITLTAGSAAVTAVASAFLANVKQGDTLLRGGITGIVQSVESNQALTLREPWAGPNYTGTIYDINHTGSGWQTNVTVNENIVALLQKIEIAGGLPNGIATGAVYPRSLLDRFSDVINVKDFGAIGDGASHPLSERFGLGASGLAAALLVYPFVTALTQQIDWAASQLAANTATLRKTGRLYWPGGRYEFGDDTLNVTSHLTPEGRSRPPVLSGDGKTHTIIQVNARYAFTYDDEAEFVRIVGIQVDTTLGGGIDISNVFGVCGVEIHDFYQHGTGTTFVALNSSNPGAYLFPVTITDSHFRHEGNEYKGGIVISTNSLAFTMGPGCFITRQTGNGPLIYLGNAISTYIYGFQIEGAGGNNDAPATSAQVLIYLNGFGDGFTLESMYIEGTVDCVVRVGPGGAYHNGKINNVYLWQYATPEGGKPSPRLLDLRESGSRDWEVNGFTYKNDTDVAGTGNIIEDPFHQVRFTGGYSNVSPLAVQRARSLIAVMPAPDFAAPAHRLSLVSGAAVSSADTVAAATVYVTPVIGSIQLPIFDGYLMRSRRCGEIPVALVAAHLANTGYSVFAYWDGAGAVQAGTGPPWASATSEGVGADTAETELLSGVLVNKYDITLRNGAGTIFIGARQATFIGAFWTTSAGFTADTLAKRLVSSFYSAAPRALRRKEPALAWVYSSYGTPTEPFRQANGNPSNQVEIFHCAEGFVTDVEYRGIVTNNSATDRTLFVEIGINSTGVGSATANSPATSSNNSYDAASARYTGVLGKGKWTLAMLERGDDTGGAVQTWIGTQNLFHAGLEGTTWG